MAIAFDAIGQGTLTSTTALTFSHTCTGSSRILWVESIVRTNTASGVTYAGVAMTQVGTGVTIGGSPDTLQLWYLVAPATGANNVVITNSGSATLMNGNSASYTGAKQTGQPDASATQTEVTQANITMTVTTVADNCWAIMVGRAGTTGDLNAGTGTTERNAGNASGLDTQMFDGNGVKTPAGSYSLQMVGSSSPTTQPMIGIMASFAPAVTTVNSNFLAFM